MKVKSRFSQRFFSSSEIQKSCSILFSRWISSAARFNFKVDQSGLDLSTFTKYHPVLLKKAFQAIESGHYVFFPAIPSVLKMDRPRPYLRLAWIDRFLLGHCGRLYSDSAEPYLSESVFSFRTGRGTHEARRYVAHSITQRKSSYVFRSDIKNFGESLLHEQVLKDFVEIAEPTQEIEFFFESLMSFPYRQGELVGHLTKGLPMGAHIQLVAENVYLRKVDVELSAIPQSFYARYGDDIVLGHCDRSLVEEGANIYTAFLDHVGLTKNEEKTFFASISAPHQVDYNRSLSSISCVCLFKYLGKEVAYNGVESFSRDKKRRVFQFFKRRIQYVAQKMDLKAKPNDRLLFLCNQATLILTSLGHARCHEIRDHLSKLSEHESSMFDRWYVELVIKTAFRGGTKKGNYRKYPPKLLRQLGLTSLVHLKRVGQL